MRYSQQMQSACKQIVSPYRCAFVAFVLCALFTACGLLCAQSGGTGAISGAITDPLGAMVVGAQVKVSDVSTGYTRTSQSNDHGMYVVSLLPPGQYTLEVTKPGFKAALSPEGSLASLRLKTQKSGTTACLPWPRSIAPVKPWRKAAAACCLASRPGAAANSENG